MGVPKFFAWLSRTHPYASAVYHVRDGNKQFQHADVLALDLNAIIHPVAQEVIKNGGSLDDVPPALIARIHKLLSIVRPTHTLIVAIDGVAPVAKINQQRKRRYLAAMGLGKKDYDSNAISPGTEFMFAIDAALRAHFEGLKEAKDHNYPPHVVYSSHLKPGEGEHTIADILRDIRLPRVAIYGSDADLIMIYLPHVLRFDDIYILREGRGGPLLIESYISLKELSQSLRTVFPTKYPEHDFITLLLLNGNDFLPRFTSLELPPRSLDTLMQAYARFLKAGGEGLSTAVDINWSSLAKFLSTFAKEDEPALLTAWGLNEDPDVRIISESKMQTLFRKSSRNSRTRQSTSVFDLQAFKRAWYSFAITTEAQSDLKVTQEDRDDMLLSYLQGINWVWTYYLKGQAGVNSFWYYPYHYPPLLEDVAEYIRKLPILDIRFNTSLTIQPSLSVLEQIISILPPASVALVPRALQPLYNWNSPIADTLPRSFRVDETGKLPSFDPRTRTYSNYQKIALLPFADPDRIQAAVRWLNLPPKVTDRYQPQTLQYYITRTSLRARAGVRYIPRKPGRGVQREELKSRPRSKSIGASEGKRERAISPPRERETYRPRSKSSGEPEEPRSKSIGETRERTYRPRSAPRGGRSRETPGPERRSTYRPRSASIGAPLKSR